MNEGLQAMAGSSENTEVDIDSLRKPVDSGCVECLRDANNYNSALDDVIKHMNGEG